VSTASDPALVERFKEALARLNPDGGRIGLAVSGGPDSMAMLLLAHEVIPGGFEVATVNHGLRPEAADECALVAAACAERGVPCKVIKVQVASGNVQARARVARYLALEDWAVARGLSAIATAHHADDQAETLLMRLNRGSGVSGLAGVRESGPSVRAKVKLIRPVLGLSRSALGAVVDGAKVTVAEDPSNQDDRFDRVTVRKALQSADWLDVDALARSARNLADAEEALQHYFQYLLLEHAGADRDYADFEPPVSREMRIRLAEWALAEIGGYPRRSEIARLVDGLARGDAGNLAGVQASIEGKKWIFRPENPRRHA
jgi:tRNA(Ile)-lysidine synthase